MDPSFRLYHIETDKPIRNHAASRRLLNVFSVQTGTIHTRISVRLCLHFRCDAIDRGSHPIQSCVRRIYKLTGMGLHGCGVVTDAVDPDNVITVPEDRRGSWWAISHHLASRSGSLKDIGTLPSDIAQRVFLADVQYLARFDDVILIKFDALNDNPDRLELIAQFIFDILHERWVQRAVFPQLMKDEHFASVRKCVRSFFAEDNRGNWFWHNFDDPDSDDDASELLYAGVSTMLELWGTMASMCAIEPRALAAMNSGISALASAYRIKPTRWDLYKVTLEAKLKDIANMTATGTALTEALDARSLAAYQAATQDTAPVLYGLVSKLDSYEALASQDPLATPQLSQIPTDNARVSDLQAPAQPRQDTPADTMDVDPNEIDAFGEADVDMAPNEALAGPSTSAPRLQSPDTVLPLVRSYVHPSSTPIKRRIDHISHHEQGVGYPSGSPPSPNTGKSRASSSVPLPEDRDAVPSSRPSPDKPKAKKIKAAPELSKKAGKAKQESQPKATKKSGSSSKQPSSQMRQTTLTASSLRQAPQGSQQRWEME